MTEKFNPVFALSIEVDDGVNTSPLTLGNQANKSLTLTLPLSVEFEISRQTQSSAQTATFRVYGLGEATRNAIQKDIFQSEQIRAIQFRAGYSTPAGDFMPLIFNGQVLQAYSSRPANVWVTEIEAFDGGYNMANGNVALTQAAGATASATIVKLANLMPIQLGAPIVGNFPTKNLRGEVLFGNIWDLIQQKSNNQAFIDNGQVKALNYSEVFAGSVTVISAETGLLGSPRRTTSTIEFDMVFEPGLTLGQEVELVTTTAPELNRKWKIQGVEHRGSIGPSMGGERTSTVKLWYTTEALQLIPGTSA